MTLGRPLAMVFDQLTTLWRLGDWLPEVVTVEGDFSELSGLGTVFAVRLRLVGEEVPGTGETIAHEPPGYVAYRLVTESCTYVIRLTCVKVGDGTRVSVHQADGMAPLAVDLAPLGGTGPGRS